MIFAVCLFMAIKLIRHLELAVIFVAVFEGDGDNVAARVVDVGDVAVRSPDMAVAYRAARSGGDVDLDVAEVLGERQRKSVAVDGGLDGGCFWHTLNVRFLYCNSTESVICMRCIGATPCHWQH